MSKKQDATLTGKQKLLVAGVSVVLLGTIATMGYFMLGGNDEVPVEDPGTELVEEQPDDTEEEVDVDDDGFEEVGFEDERDEMDEDLIEEITQQVYDYAYAGQWYDIMTLVDRYDRDYNLDTEGDGEHLRALFQDANVIARLIGMGDNTDALEMSVQSIPTLQTPEIFVLALYYLPRNVILEMSQDTMALAPTQRGMVELVERTDFPISLEDGSRNDALDDDEAIQRYFSGDYEDMFEEGFIRFDILNYNIEEYAYIVINADGSFGLVGIYSEDTNPANTTKPVHHYREFNQDVEKGVEELLKQAQDDYDAEREVE